MRAQEHVGSADLLAARERYAPRGVATPALAVARAEGAWIPSTISEEELDAGLDILEAAVGG